jgi:hypothetical protein
MAAALEQGGLAVTRLPLRDTQPGSMRLRQAMVVSPRALVPGSPRVIALRVNSNPAQRIQAAMMMQPFVPPTQARPPEPDDAVPD